LFKVVFPYVEIGLVVKAAADEVWKVLIDTSRWAEWGPSVRAVACPDRFLTVLSSGWVRTVLGFSVPFAVTRFEPGRSWSWRVLGVPATTHTVESLGTNRSQLSFGVPLMVFPYLLVCLVAIKRLRAIIEQGRDPASCQTP